MIRTQSELLEQFNSIIGEQSDDNTLAFLDDLADTLSSVNNSAERIATLERENRELDEQWRKKYKERFFSAQPVEEEIEPDTPAPKLKFEDLFN